MPEISDLGSRGIVLFCVAKTKAPISCAVTAQLICVFVFAYAKNRFSHNEAQISSGFPKGTQDTNQAVQQKMVRRFKFQGQKLMRLVYYLGNEKAKVLISLRRSAADLRLYINLIF